MTEPALQTINATPEFRKLFKARDRHSLVVCDYGQIEVRVPAALSQDKVLLEAIEDGLDIHTLTARHCFRGDYPDNALDTFFRSGEGKWMRQAAKACIFGLLFGQGPRGLAQVLTTNGHPTSPHEAGRIQHEVLDLYTGLREWIRKTRERADRTGYLWTPQGRVYAPFKSNQLFTKSINTPCQGGAAEIMLLALSKFPNSWGSIPAKLVHVVHDELIAEVPDEFAAHARTTWKRRCDGPQRLCLAYLNGSGRGRYRQDVGRQVRKTNDERTLQPIPLYSAINSQRISSI